MRMGRREGQGGFTYLELVAVAFILMILASAVMPLARVSYRRTKEIELRRALREVRTAIDQFRAGVQQGRIGGTDVRLGAENCPADLDTLVKGVTQVGGAGNKLKFLRRIPVDPMTGSAEWGLRCYQDEPDSTSWCGQNVWDIYSKSEEKGLNGIPYKEW
jgi:general secretion pathway protein G